MELVDKKLIKLKQLKLLKSISLSEKQFESGLVYKNLFHWSGWIEAKNIALTISLPYEIDTFPIIKEAWENHKNVYIPRIEDVTSRKMNFIKYDEGDSLFSNTNYKFLEPNKNMNTIKTNDLNLVIVPAIAIEKDHGYRIGTGNGYYDRFLQNFHNNTASLALKFQIYDTPTWLTDSFDIRIKNIITKKEIYKCND